ncbi:MAG: undecaprenyldiphospho-muramoylpentapeptide beta-N-acetylglucosaminyltransferase [Rhodospirillales bacterium]
MNRAVNRTVALAAGGSGGHVFPAEALAETLSARGYAVALITDGRGGGFGAGLAGVETHLVSAGAVAGKTGLARVKSLAALGFGAIAARRILKRLRPACVAGFGGYASVPAVWAAAGRYPTLIHEQNAVLGRANRVLSRRVDRIATAFPKIGGLAPGLEDKLRHTGMPVRPAVAAARARAYAPPEPDGALRILVLGGSQGARVFSDVVPRAVAAQPPGAQARLRIEQQCRPEDLDRVRAAYEELGVNAELKSFFDDIPERLARAHLVIARAGASTAAELTAVGRPAILVPYPYAVDNHQDANAHAMADAGAGWLTPEPSFTPETLAARLDSVLSNPSLLSAMAQGAFAAGVVDAAGRLADLIDELAAPRVHQGAGERAA